MTFPNLHDIQLLMLRACVSNLMLLATLPFHWTQEMRPMPERSRRASHASSVPQNGRVWGSEDRRWLR